MREARLPWVVLVVVVVLGHVSCTNGQLIKVDLSTASATVDGTAVSGSMDYIDAEHMLSVTHEELLAASEMGSEARINEPTPTPTQSTPAAAAVDTLIPEFDLASYPSAAAALAGYSDWHTKTLASPKSCQARSALVWRAAAVRQRRQGQGQSRLGWGDSVNALTSSFRYAIGNGLLFFIIWSSVNDAHIWRHGLQEPGFAWDWKEFLAAHPDCGFTEEQLFKVNTAPPGSLKLSSGKFPRLNSLLGSITSDHPLAGSLEHWYNRKPRSILSMLNDGLIQDSLLRPNALLSEWIAVTRKELKTKRKKNFGGVIGIQIRTGAADLPLPTNFLAKGDEQLFLNKFLDIYAKKYDSNPDRTRVFLMTDDPAVQTKIIDEIQTKRGVQVVTVTNGPIAHCGPHQTISSDGVLRMLTDWYIFRTATDVQLITAWSLFGSSAVEGKNEGNIYRIDASTCGQKGMKPCQSTRR